MRFFVSVLAALCIAEVYGIDPEIGIDPITRLPLDNNPNGVEAQATGVTCTSGARQSPININTCIKSTMKALRTVGHSDNRPAGFTMVNTGSSAQITYGGDAPTMYGGPLPTGSEYTLVQAHFHWGNNDSVGSEHARSGNYGPLEMHFVHRKSNYANLSVALTNEDGLAVFGVLFAIQPMNNTRLDKIISKLSSIPQPSSATVTLDADAMVWLTGIVSHFEYFNYPGSLTTGDCNEVVNWIVMKRTIGISAAQVAEFRKLKDANNQIIPEARRDVQSLKSRVIQCARGCVAPPDVTRLVESGGHV